MHCVHEGRRIVTAIGWDGFSGDLIDYRLPEEQTPAR